MMKKLLLLHVLACLSIAAFSQTYAQLGTDGNGDVTQAGRPDFKLISYTENKLQDSIWFKVEFHNAITPTQDFGMMMVLDTNMNTLDGNFWLGTNKSMRYDVVFFVFLNSFQPEYFGAYGQQGGASAQIGINVKRPDNFTFIIGTKLSDIDADGRFNFMAGSGSFDIAFTPNAPFDQVPNTGYFTLPVSDIWTKVLSPLPSQDLITDTVFNYTTRVYNKGPYTLPVGAKLSRKLTYGTFSATDTVTLAAAIGAGDSVTLATTVTPKNLVYANNVQLCSEIRLIGMNDNTLADNKSCVNVDLRSGMDKDIAVRLVSPVAGQDLFDQGNFQYTTRIINMGPTKLGAGDQVIHTITYGATPLVVDTTSFITDLAIGDSIDVQRTVKIEIPDNVPNVAFCTSARFQGTTDVNMINNADCKIVNLKTGISRNLVVRITAPAVNQTIYKGDFFDTKVMVTNKGNAAVPTSAKLIRTLTLNTTLKWTDTVQLTMPLQPGDSVELTKSVSPSINKDTLNVPLCMEVQVYRSSDSVSIDNKHCTTVNLKVSKTGIADGDGGLKMIVYPNPANVFLSFPSFEGEALIYDLSGRLLIRADIDADHQSVAVDALRTGLYVYKAISPEGKTATGKVMISH